MANVDESFWDIDLDSSLRLETSRDQYHGYMRKFKTW